MNFLKTIFLLSPDEGGSAGGEGENPGNFNASPSGSEPTSQGATTGDVNPVTLAKSEYERFLAMEKQFLSMIPKDEYDRKMQEISRNEAKNKVKAEAEAFKNSKELLNLTKEIENYNLKLRTDDFSSLDAVRIAFIEEVKSKYDLNFEIDKSGDLDTQIKNLCLLVQETNIYKQLDNARLPDVGATVNETRAAQAKKAAEAAGRF